ncbi:retrovirus-related pol polyprotein from transposon TNT 1-94, partial [Tanacetum coccineum]
MLPPMRYALWSWIGIFSLSILYICGFFSSRAGIFERALSRIITSGPRKRDTRKRLAVSRAIGDKRLAIWVSNQEAVLYCFCWTPKSYPKRFVVPSESFAHEHVNVPTASSNLLLKPIILINGQFPGPRLDVVTNDNIVLNFINKFDELFLLTCSDKIQFNYTMVSKVGGFKLPNRDTATDYVSADESSVCGIPLPLLEKLVGAKPISGPKTIQSILKSNSIFKPETLKGVTINEPTTAPVKGNNDVSASKRNSAPTGKLKMTFPWLLKPIWYIDIGCSRHMTGVKSYLHKYVEQPRPKVVFGDDSACTTKEGIIFNSNKEVMIIAPRVRDVYVLDMTSSAQQSCFFAKASESLNWLWHKKLAHLNLKTINELAKQNLVIRIPSLVYSKDKLCSSCEKGKHHRASFKTKQTSSIKKWHHLLYM